MQIEIPTSELNRARSLWNFVRFDERSGLGELRLRSDGQRRTWIGCDQFQGMMIEGGSDRQVYDIGLSWQAVIATDFISWTDDDMTLSLDRLGDTAVITLDGPGGRLSYLNRELPYPDISLMSAENDGVAGVATTTAGALADLVSAARWKREWDEDGDRPPGYQCWLHFDEGTVVFETYSRELGRAQLSIPVPGCDSAVQVLLDPDKLHDLCSRMPRDDEVTVLLSRLNDDPVVFEGSDWRAFLMPLKTPFNQLVDRLEGLLADSLGPLARIRDHDGDYPLRRHGIPVYGRVVSDDDGTVWFQVFAVLAGGVEPSHEVCRELNDLNATGRYARLFHVEQQILAEVDLLAATLDADELHEAIERITAMANEVMPTLTLVLGGEVTPNDSDRRWAAYRGSVLEAEILPGQNVVLTGTAGTPEWPFPGPVFVITGWNPSGRAEVGDAWNRNVNRAIAVDVIECSGRFVDGVGRSATGDHAEESLVVWGLDRETVRSMGVRASQDAIFEVDADEVRLISCVDDRVEAWPRRS